MTILINTDNTLTGEKRSGDFFTSQITEALQGSNLTSLEYKFTLKMRMEKRTDLITSRVY